MAAPIVSASCQQRAQARETEPALELEQAPARTAGTVGQTSAYIHRDRLTVAVRLAVLVYPRAAGIAE